MCPTHTTSPTEELRITAEVASLAAMASAAKGGLSMQAPLALMSSLSNPTTVVARVPLHDAMWLMQELPKMFRLFGGQVNEEARTGMVGNNRVSVACIECS